MKTAVQTNNLNLYKIYQVMDFFVTKYSFYTFVVRPQSTENEIWLANKDNKEVSIIRISCTSLDETFMDKTRIQNVVDTISKTINKKSFLDIHISLEQVGEVEIFDTLCLETKYHSGKDISSVFPGIYDVVHDVDNQEEEIKSKILSINTSLKQRLKLSQLGSKINKIGIPVTYAIIIICSIMEGIYYYLSTKYGESIALLYLGADYNVFTVGFGQYWRLLTYGFLHAGFFHLLINMYSFYIIGGYFERTYGKLKYILILLTGIFVGGLAHNIMSKDSISIGLSGGIYTLFSIYIIDALNRGAWRSAAFMMMVFINIMLNFMSGIAWQTHLGGAIVGLIYYMMFKDKKINYGMIVLLIVMIVLMFVKTIMG